MEGLVFGTRIYNRILKNIKDRNPSGNNRNSSAESEDFIKVIKKIIVSEESKQQEGFYGADNKAELKKQKTAVSDDSAGKEVTDRIRAVSYTHLLLTEASGRSVHANLLTISS